METILLIEDNEVIRENTREILELEGYEVLAASDGEAGLQQAFAHTPDLILCDILIPKLDGYMVFKELKNNSDTTKIPFLFLTASAEDSEKALGLEMGAEEYIRKPFEEMELLEAIKRCLKP